jgi:hypothetical protein
LQQPFPLRNRRRTWTLSNCLKGGTCRPPQDNGPFQQLGDMMLTLCVIDANPAGASAVTWFGVIVLALVAAVVVGLWVVAAGKLARGNDSDLDESADDPGLEALRHRRLVVRRPRGRQAAVVAELAPETPSDRPAHPESG